MLLHGVYSSSRRSFSVSVPASGIHTRKLRALIEASITGREMQFAASSWGVFMAPEGVKPDGAAELEDLALITPIITPVDPIGGAVNVWVERVVPPAAGEPSQSVPVLLLVATRSSPPILVCTCSAFLACSRRWRCWCRCPRCQPRGEDESRRSLRLCASAAFRCRAQRGCICSQCWRWCPCFA